MKRFLRLMAMLWPLRKLSAFGDQLSATYGNYKRKHIGGKPLKSFMCADPCQAPALPGLGLALGLTLCLNFQLFAQEDIKPLQVGDTIPEEVWNLSLQVVNHPDGKETITLADYKDKLIILDFWATWCKPCISSLYKLDTLQGQFTDDIVVIPSTREAEEKATSFITDKGWSLPSAVLQNTLQQYFPHRSIPHQVWVRDGKLLAIAGSEYTNVEYIGKVLQGQKVDFDHKIEVAFDKSKPLFLDGNGGDGSNMLYQSVISGRLQARVAGTNRPNPNEIIAYNYPIEMLYKTALENSTFMPFNNDRYIVYDVHDTLKYRISRQTPKTIQNDSLRSFWADENLYCYNLVMPIGSGTSNVNNRMFQDLNDFFGSYLNVIVSIEERKVMALAIVRKASYQDISTQGGESFRKWDSDTQALTLQNMPLDYFVYYMNAILDNRPRTNLAPYNYPIVDETGIMGKVDMTISAKFPDIESVKVALNKYGLDLVEKITPVKMIIFKYNQHPKQ